MSDMYDHNTANNMLILTFRPMKLDKQFSLKILKSWCGQAGAYYLLFITAESH